MEWIKVSARTVADAVTEASIQLGTSSDNIEYRVVEQGSAGFLGLFGAKKAVIEAKKKKSDEDLMEEVFRDKKDAPKKETKKENAAPKEQKKENAAPKEQKKVNKEIKKEVKKETKKEEKLSKENKNHKKVKEHEAEAPKISGTEEVKVEEVKEEKPPRAPREPADPEVAKSRAEKFLTDIFRTMGMKVEMEISFEEDSLSVDIKGDDMGLLIGKRGQTLDSLQYLTSLVVNKGNASYVRVKLDTEDYRNRRKATLENLAKNIAMKVKKTRRPVFLEPMNPYERRIIHSALQNDPYVTTHSEGEEPCRKVVVTLKKSNERYEKKQS